MYAEPGCRVYGKDFFQYGDIYGFYRTDEVVLRLNCCSLSKPFRILSGAIFTPRNSSLCVTAYIIYVYTLSSPPRLLSIIPLDLFH